MINKFSKSNLLIFIISFMAIGFGILTLKSGGFALFGGEIGKQFAGKYIPFVLWFNFIAGFFYILSGVGIAFRKRWGVVIAKTLALSTVFIFIGVGGVILLGAEYEIRTVGAMAVRSIFWITVFLISNKDIHIAKVR